MKASMKTLLVLVFAAALPLAARANGDTKGEDRGQPVQPAQASAMWQKECSACHMAFQPSLLPAESWRKVMAGLDKHFEVDASLSAQDAGEITAFLVAHASNRWRAKTAPLRITESGWFKAKHDAREIAPAVWKRPAVKGPSNCVACHGGAEKGEFDEKKVRIPK
jgi:Dihaem cytochrome c